MYQIIEQTEEEKIAMYMKMPKKQIIKMLLNCNRLIDELTKPTKTYKYKKNKP